MTELAIVNAKKRKLEEMAESGNERAKKAFELAENPNEMFSTIQIGITLVGILTGLYSGATFSGPLEEILVQIFQVSIPMQLLLVPSHRCYHHLFIPRYR